MSGIREIPENPNIGNISRFADILQIVKIGMMLTIYQLPDMIGPLSLAGNLSVRGRRERPAFE